MFWELSSQLISFVQRGWDHQPEQWLCQCGKTAFDYDVKQAACPSEQVPPGFILVSDQPWKWMSIKKLTHISWQKSKSTKTEMIDPSLVDHAFLIKLAHNWSLHGLTFFQIFWNLARLLASANWLKGESKKESNQFDADVTCFFPWTSLNQWSGTSSLASVSPWISWTTPCPGGFFDELLVAAASSAINVRYFCTQLYAHPFFAGRMRLKSLRLMKVMQADWVLECRSRLVGYRCCLFPKLGWVVFSAVDWVETIIVNRLFLEMEWHHNQQKNICEDYKALSMVFLGEVQLYVLSFYASRAVFVGFPDLLMMQWLVGSPSPCWWQKLKCL